MTSRSISRVVVIGASLVASLAAQLVVVAGAAAATGGGTWPVIARLIER